MPSALRPERRALITSLCGMVTPPCCLRASNSCSARQQKLSRPLRRTSLSLPKAGARLSQLVTVAADSISSGRAGVHPKIREQLGNKYCPMPSKTVYHDIGKDKERQPHSVLKSHLQAGGRRFDPGHVHQLSSNRVASAIA